MKIIIKTDGSCKKNPGGTMGIGIYDTNLKKEMSYIPVGTNMEKLPGTNNIAELLAIAKGMEYFLNNYDVNEHTLEIKTDSKLSVNWVKKGRTGNPNQFWLEDILSEIKKLKFRISGFKITWIQREGNSVADYLSKNNNSERLVVCNYKFTKELYNKFKNGYDMDIEGLTF